MICDGEKTSDFVNSIEPVKLFDCVNAFEFVKSDDDVNGEETVKFDVLENFDESENVSDNVNDPDVLNIQVVPDDPRHAERRRDGRYHTHLRVQFLLCRVQQCRHLHQVSERLSDAQPQMCQKLSTGDNRERQCVHPL